MSESPPPDPPGHITPARNNSPTRIHSPGPAPSQFGNPNPPSSNIATSSMTGMDPPDRPWPAAPFAPGVDAKTPKTANRVYIDIVASMLTEAQHKFECLVCTENAYPDISTQFNWAYKCWEAVCLRTGAYYDLSKEMLCLVCRFVPSPVVTGH